MLPPIKYYELYMSFKAWDKAPKLAKEYFAGMTNDQQTIDETMQRLLLETADASTRREIGYASNLAQVEALLNTGKKEAATRALEALARDGAIAFLDIFLGPLGTSYSQLSIESDRFLTPQRLDEVLFERYAPKSKELSREYCKKQGFAVVMRKGEVYEVILFYDNSYWREVTDDAKGIGSGEVNICIGSADFTNNGSVKKIEEPIRRGFNKLSISDYCVIIADNLADNDALPRYLVNRFLVERVGRLMQKMPIKYIPNLRVVGFSGSDE